jgi:DNA-directed RNA polymerase subunit RPC12/RpoP
MNRDPYSIAAKRAARRPPERAPDFDELEAMELYCPKCRMAVPVRKYLLLVLPEGDKYEYRCQHCGTTVGDKIDRGSKYRSVF